MVFLIINVVEAGRIKCSFKTLVSDILGLVAKHNSKVKKYYEGFVKVEEQIKKLMINAEGYYTSGEQKKKHVVSNIQSFLNQNNINI